MKKVIYALCLMPYALGVHAAPHTGFYKTIDDKTNAPKSIVQLHECEDRLCGRIVALFDADTGEISETIKAPVKIAEKVKGAPKMSGLEIIWDMKWDGTEYIGGKIMDPQSGSVYSSVIWQDKDDASLLRVRGKVGPFGRTQVWHAITELPPELQGIDL
ncbi:MAG: DUF2147 domain-containing protein [Alphaproteobacteria bacterium]|nr:DUF2147 domain-containing protein [Alphaproteobacteria bacterium]